MKIECILTTEKGLKSCALTQEVLLELVKGLKKGSEHVHTNSGETYLVDGIYIPSKGNKSAIMVLPNFMEDENGRNN